MADWMQRLTDWTRNRRAPTIPQSIVATPSVPKGGEAGEYRLLFKYLRDRYANRVVLTFSEIEDLLGFELPEGARRQQRRTVDVRRHAAVRRFEHLAPERKRRDSHGWRRGADDPRTAVSMISTRPSGATRPDWTVARAGKSRSKNARYTSFIAPRYFRSVR